MLGATFQIGRSALNAYQAAIAVTGQNIANVGNPDSVRQSVRLAAQHGGMTTAGVAPGTGVGVVDLRRHIDEAVESRLRLALSDRSGADARYQALSQTETLFGELSGHDLSTQLNDLFGIFTNLQTEPENTALRGLAISAAQSLADALQAKRAGVLDQVRDLNDTIAAQAGAVNGITREIAELNERIAAAAVRRNGSDNALRDRRDSLLRELSDFVDVRTKEYGNGVVNVFVNSEPLVDFGRAREIEARSTVEAGVERTELRFGDTGDRVRARSGRLAAALEVRDQDLRAQIDGLDRMAAALIFETNRAHSGGRGLVGYDQLEGAFAAADPDAALDSAAAGLAFPIKNGTLQVHLRDTRTGATSTRLIEVDLDGIDDDDTLRTLIDKLDAVGGLSARLSADNRALLYADDGNEVWFSNDTSDALAALGLGAFFEGQDAATIAVSASVQADPRRIATSASGAPGDGSVAGRIAAAVSTPSPVLNGSSVESAHEQLTQLLATAAAGAAEGREASDAVYSGLLAQREASSGVSLDEEAINLTMFERAFQGASRYLNVVNAMTEELMTITR